MSKPTSLERWYDGFPHMADQIKEMRGALLERDATITRLEAAIAQARRDALEEAAKVCIGVESHRLDVSEWRMAEGAADCAKFIRALASPPAAQSDREPK